MARVKLSEYKSKSLLFKELGIAYTGEAIISAKLPQLSSNKLYVVKVDKGIKKRMKKGLVQLDVKSNEVKQAVTELKKKGYERFIVEEMVQHEVTQEKYVAIER